MKTVFALLVAAFALLLGGCADQPLMSDEEYNARHPPASHSPDYSSSVLPQTSTKPTGWQ
jgi:hypothetical protein